MYHEFMIHCWDSLYARGRVCLHACIGAHVCTHARAVVLHAGVDINRIGVKPDIPIAPATLAVGGDKVCKQMALPDAPRLF